MKKKTLILLAIAVVAMGVLALIPNVALGSEPVLYSWLKIIVGLGALYIGIKKD